MRSSGLAPGGRIFAHDDVASAGELRENSRRKPDRAAAHDQHALADRHLAAIDGVEPDRKRLDRCAFPVLHGASEDAALRCS